MLKKIAIGVVVLLVVVAGIVYYLFSSLDSIIKAEIEKYGTAATQGEVTLAKVNLSLTSGEGGLVGLIVANPKGFSTPNAIAFGAIDIKVDTGSVTGSGPIVIHEVTIDKPQVTYERTNSGSNIDTIEQNTEAYAGASKSGSTATASQPASSSSSSGGDAGRKVIIENLYVRDGQIGISHALLQGKVLSAPLPTIHLSNIGKGTGGATPAQVAEQVLGAIGNAASKVSVAALEKQFGSLSGVVGDKVKGAVPGGIGDAAKGLLGK